MGDQRNFQSCLIKSQISSKDAYCAPDGNAFYFVLFDQTVIKLLSVL